MKQLLLLTAILLLNGNWVLAQFSVKDYKGKPNSEVLLELKNVVEQIKSIERFSDVFGEKEEMFYAKDELEPAFKLDTTIALQTFYEFTNTKFKLYQTLKEGGSELKMDDGDFHGSLSGKTFTIKLVPKRFYFYDGTTADGVSHITMDFAFAEDIPFSKRIDSIACDIILDYVTSFDKVEISTAKPAATYKNNFIKLLKANKNDLEFIYNKDLDYDFVEGLNANGNPLDDKSHSTTNIKNRGFKMFRAIREPLETIISAAEKDTVMDRTAFQEKYMRLLEKEFVKIPQNDTMLRVAKYKGAVKGARLWFATSKKQQQLALTIKAAGFSDIHFETGDTYGVLRDNNGKELMKVDKTITDITPWFYQDDQRFLYLDLAGKKMEPLPYYSLQKLTNNYVVAKEDEEGADILIDKKNKRLGAFEDIESSGETVIAFKKDDVLMITPDEQQVWHKGVEEMSEMENGYAVIRLNGKYGFVDTYGKMSIPAEYEGAVPFDDMDGYTKSDLLFAVKKNGKWGFINTLNKVVVPFEYDEVLPFSYGVTMAIKDGKRGLISTSNQIIVPFNNGSSFGLSKNFGKRSYSLSTGSYNYSGRKEK
ncbi:WG repeat-containing protein [Niabella yanshanensis]|uniref:WG repeat-containing protein n=1 Tax=Niabella yanshanensis TaxID=577386 RepID=A0ABZ0W3S1_9BACT|nr:WG repeat-containing protein [Niabella yanshanensis]WQD37851.1 WG repeat-containing protein [Niabella yanshanensis]